MKNVPVLINTVKQMKKPPKDPIKSLQLDLFSQFVTNDQSWVSNTIELWGEYQSISLQLNKLKSYITIDGL